MILIPVGFVIAVVLIYYSGFIYMLWLHEVPDGSISATTILAVWQLITIMNIPFWLLLQAAHHEKIAAIAIWAHTLFIVFLVPLKVFGVSITFNQLLLYWTITALFTQALIYTFVEKKLSIFWEVFKDGILIKMIITSIMFFCIQVFMCSCIRLT